MAAVQRVLDVLELARMILLSATPEDVLHLKRVNHQLLVCVDSDNEQTPHRR